MAEMFIVPKLDIFVRRAVAHQPLQCNFCVTAQQKTVIEPNADYALITGNRAYKRNVRDGLGDIIGKEFFHFERRRDGRIITVAGKMEEYIGVQRMCLGCYGKLANLFDFHALSKQGYMERWLVQDLTIFFKGMTSKPENTFYCEACRTIIPGNTFYYRKNDSRVCVCAKCYKDLNPLLGSGEPDMIFERVKVYDKVLLIPE